MVPILRGLDSAEAGGVAIDLAPSYPITPTAVAVPLWRPAWGGDLVSGLDVEVTRQEVDL